MVRFEDQLVAISRGHPRPGVRPCSLHQRWRTRRKSAGRVFRFSLAILMAKPPSGTSVMRSLPTDSRNAGFLSLSLLVIRQGLAHSESHRLPLHPATPEPHHLQPVAGEPLATLIGPRRQAVLNRRLYLPRPSPADPSQPAQLLFAGSRYVLGNFLRCRRRQSLPLRKQGYLRTVARDHPIPSAI